MKKEDEIREMLGQYPQYRETLFCRGYLVTTKIFENTDKYPFYSLWNRVSCGRLYDGFPLNIYFHRWQKCYLFEKEGKTAAIIGHAYNPFNMKYAEEEILKDCMEAYNRSHESFFEKVSELTGIHLIILNETGKVTIVQDCSGMRACYFGRINEDICLTSHPRLAEDLWGLRVDPFVKELTEKWFFRFGQRYMPGNLSPYRELKKLGPNTYLEMGKEFRVKRFYPLKPHPELSSERYEDVLGIIGGLMKKNIELCISKWKIPAISLSGGMDSKTTFACANSLYDKLKCYSFHCKPAEVADAEAAHKICDAIGIKHDIYSIPANNDQIEDFGILKRIISHNAGYLHVPPEHEIRKYIYLYRLNDFDVELKSWVSEIGRAVWERKYNLEFPEILKPYHFSIFQTRYILAPALLRKSNDCYKEYLKEINLEKPLHNYEHTDSYVWEFAFGFWGATVFTSQEIFRHEVTIPMNNRKLVDMFLWFPHEYRKGDMVHKKLIELTNKKISDLNISVHNADAGMKRILLEQAYYRYATLFKQGMK